VRPLRTSRASLCAPHPTPLGAALGPPRRAGKEDVKYHVEFLRFLNVRKAVTNTTAAAWRAAQAGRGDGDSPSPSSLSPLSSSRLPTRSPSAGMDALTGARGAAWGAPVPVVPPPGAVDGFAVHNTAAAQGVPVEALSPPCTPAAGGAGLKRGGGGRGGGGGGSGGGGGGKGGGPDAEAAAAGGQLGLPGPVPQPRRCGLRPSHANDAKLFEAGSQYYAWSLSRYLRYSDKFTALELKEAARALGSVAAAAAMPRRSPGLHEGAVASLMEALIRLEVGFSVVAPWRPCDRAAGVASAAVRGPGVHPAPTKRPPPDRPVPPPVRPSRSHAALARAGLLPPGQPTSRAPPPRAPAPPGAAPPLTTLGLGAAWRAQWELCLRECTLAGSAWFHVCKMVWRALRSVEDPLRHGETDRFLSWIRAVVVRDLSADRAARLLRMRALAELSYVETLKVASAMAGEVVDAVTTRALPHIFAWTCA
jgi:hypothetical protein